MTAGVPGPRRRPAGSAGGLVLVEDRAPWYATAPVSPREHRRELEDELQRLLAQAVGDHLPYELALRAGDLAAELDANIDPGGGW